ncbi:hypothetical protein GFS31_25220 [Leptolyngbya sp. BL0902]|nr:hypothetical protein GFS31_25220 [Leptolyngbya sp. BL0902]
MGKAIPHQICITETVETVGWEPPTIEETMPYDNRAPDMG